MSVHLGAFGQKLYVGATPVRQAYVGAQLVYDSAPTGGQAEPVQVAWSKSLAGSESGLTALSITFTDPTTGVRRNPTAGRLLTAHLSTDKGVTGMTLTDDSGAVWTALNAYEGPSVSGRVWWRTATGTEGTLTASWTTPHGAALAVVEHYLTGAAVVAQAVVPSPVDDATRTELTATATVAGNYVLLTAGLDTVDPNGANPAGIGWDEGVTPAVSQPGRVNNGFANVYVAVGVVPQSGTLNVRASWATADQGWLHRTTLTGTRVPVDEGTETPVEEPEIPAQPGARDVALHPFASDSVWNLPIATGATFEAATDPATSDLRAINKPEGKLYVNQNEYSHPVYQAGSTSPVYVVVDRGTASRSITVADDMLP